jgi:hypothetical protein
VPAFTLGFVLHAITDRIKMQAMKKETILLIKIFFAKLTVNGSLNLKQSSLTNKKEAGKI